MLAENQYILKPYDDALRRIYNDGFDITGDRTGVGTRCLFGISTEYDVSEYVPILVYRKAFWKSIVKETLWYISGSHMITDLEAMGAGIWTPWKNEAFTDKHSLPEGSGGYIYGYNLRNFGGSIHAQMEYDSEIELLDECGFDDAQESEAKFYLDKKYSNRFGFDQLEYVISTLRKNPQSRQACFTFWRPDTNHMAVLPACHAFYSFIVSPDKEGNLNTLNLHLFQRSADYPIGVGAGNLWTGTLFLYMIAQQLDMKVGKLYHTGSHCHIYHNAMEKVKEYLDRIDQTDVSTIQSPKLILNKKPSIFDYTVDDFELVDYNPLSKIDMPIAV